jgi:DNA adenine methylase
MIDTAVKSLVPYFGGKRTLAPVIVEQLGKHRAYWEPFCGSMAVLFAKPAVGMETVCDLHGDLINLAHVIQHESAGPTFYRRLRRLMLMESNLEDACQQLDNTPLVYREPNIDRAIAYFIQSWMMRSGVAGTNLQKRGAGRSIAIRYTPKGGALNPRWVNAVDSIPSFRRRLRYVLIMRRSAFEILPKIDDCEGQAIYLDPPYLAETRSGMKGSGAQSRYLHDFAGDKGDMFGDDHTRLADELNRFKKCRVVISYYDHPRLEQMYPGWSKIYLNANKAIVQQGKRGGMGGEKAPEVLIINGPSYAKV